MFLSRIFGKTNVSCNQNGEVQTQQAPDNCQMKISCNDMNWKISSQAITNARKPMISRPTNFDFSDRFNLTNTEKEILNSSIRKDIEIKQIDKFNHDIKENEWADKISYDNKNIKTKKERSDFGTVQAAALDIMIPKIKEGIYETAVYVKGQKKNGETGEFLYTIDPKHNSDVICHTTNGERATTNLRPNNLTYDSTSEFENIQNITIFAADNSVLLRHMS